MCGIAGFIGKNTADAEAQIQNMLAPLRQRGPDAQGYQVFNNGVFGHTRLSIIDLEHGAQPMLGSGPASSCLLTFNGEIYDYQKLKKNLNYPFKSSSDSEVLLALYADRGEAMLDTLPGMFSFAIWDGKKKSLFAARDRFGEKPFYYARSSRGGLVFASEIKSILASGLIHPQYDRTVLAEFMQLLYVPPGRCIYKNIFCLPPGHALSFKKDKIKTWAYWSPAPANASSLSPSEAAANFKDLLTKSIQRQLIADVPTAAFLSGGLDSSSVLTSASKIKPGITALSYGFSQGDSELPWARQVAAGLNVQHVELNDENLSLEEAFLQSQKYFDEPFADSSSVPTWLLSKLARQRAKVVLTGDGGDELLGGYAGWYLPLEKMANGSLPDWSLPWLLRLHHWATRFKLAAYPPPPWLEGQRLRRHYPHLAAAHREQQSWFRNEQLSALGLPLPEPPAATNVLNQILVSDTTGYMAGDILVKTDRMSMAHGLELRSPLLDKDVAEFCLSLPIEYKIKNGQDKRLLREAYRAELPASVRTRRKQGFGSPVDAWLKRPGFKKIQQDYLGNDSAAIYKILDPTLVKPHLAEGNYRTWILLCLSVWAEKQA